jgi:hypothetical protein
MLVLVVALAVGCESDGSKSSAGSSKSPSASASTSTPRSRAGHDDALYAYVDTVRGELSDGKTQLINKIMRLSRDESAKFWPIYHDYEDELFALGDERVEMTRKFVTAQATGSLDNDRAKALADDWFKFESSRLDLLRKYHQLIAKELSPLRAAQFTQIEHRVGVVIDLVVASEIPLLEEPRTARR